MSRPASGLTPFRSARAFKLLVNALSSGLQQADPANPGAINLAGRSVEQITRVECLHRGLQVQNVVSWIEINRLRATGLWDFASCGVSEVGARQPPFVWLHTVGIFGGRSGKYFVSCSSYPGTVLTKVLHLKLFDRYPIFRIPSPFTLLSFGLMRLQPHTKNCSPSSISCRLDSSVNAGTRSFIWS